MSKKRILSEEDSISIRHYFNRLFLLNRRYCRTKGNGYIRKSDISKIQICFAREGKDKAS